jgi:hypothetical protein
MTAAARAARRKTVKVAPFPDDLFDPPVLEARRFCGRSGGWLV